MKNSQKEVIASLCELVKKDMNQQSRSDFSAKRLANQLNWYRKHAASNRRKFYIIHIIIAFLPLIAMVLNISAATTIVFVKCANPLEYLRHYKAIISAIFNAFISACGIIDGLYRYREHWCNYRKALEDVISLAGRYSSMRKPYDSANNNRTNDFLSDVEDIICNETSSWAVNNKKT